MTNTFFSYNSKDGKIFGNIDFNKLKSGITKQELGIEEGSVLSSIFDSLDTNEEEGSKGKLDRQEINKFIQIISSLVGNDTKLDGKEAGKYKINGENVDKTGNELLNFIDKLSKLTNDVSNVEVKDDSEVINYGNGNVEEVFSDGSKFIKENVGNQIQERVFDANGKVVKFTIIEHGEIIRDENTTYDENGEPKFQEVTEIANAWNTNNMINTKRHNVHSLYEYNKATKQFELKSSVEKYINDDNQNQTNFKVVSDDGTEEYVEVVDNLTRYHSRKSGFKFEEIKFDKDGCLTGYFIQNGETSKSIAEKFGISEDLLKRANPSVAFLPMTEIRIPKQVDLDDPAVQSRKTKDEIWNDLPKSTVTWEDSNDGHKWKEDLAILKSKLKHNWQIAVDKQGTQYILNSKGEVMSDEEIAEQLAWDAAPKTKTSDGKVVVILQKSIPQYPKCSWVRDRAGNTYVLNKDNKLCDPNDLFSYADVVIAHYNNGYPTKVIVVKDDVGKGRKIVQEEDGSLHYMDAENRIIPNEEVAKTNYKDEIKSKPETAMKAVITIIRKAYQNARAAFDKQCREQGWTSHAADSIASLWGSDNTEEKVRQKLDYYEAQIRMLEQCMSMGRYNDFKGTFYEMFKVNFNENSLINYIDNPSLDNYYRIFGKNNDVSEVVGKYVSSQNLGSNIVKAATGVVTGLVGTALMPFTGGTSSVLAFAGFTGVASAIVSLTDRVSSVVGLQDGDLTQIAKDAGWDAVSALAGGAVSKAASIAIKGTTALATVTRMGIEVSGDIATGAVQELVEQGEITKEGMIRSMIFSAGGNVVFRGIGKGVEYGTGAVQALRRSSSPDIADLGSHTSTKPIEVQPKTPTVTQPEIKTPKIGEEVHTQPKGGTETPVITPKKKTISEMNENELLAEHNRLRQETLSKTVSKDIKAENIRQMKEIEQALSQKGLKIEQGQLTKIKVQEAEPKTEPQSTEQTVTTKADLKAKLGKSLFEFHEMIENSIEKMQTMADFTRLKNVITTKFKDFTDVMSELLTKLENKAKQLGLNIKEGLSDIGDDLVALEKRIGKKLTKLYTKISDAINNLSTEKQFNKISKSINKHFAEFEDIFSNLFNKLENKAKQIGLNVESHFSQKKSFQPVKTPLSDLQPVNLQIVKSVAQKYHCPVLDCNYGAKTFQRGNKFVVDLATNKDTQISLGPLVSVDLNEPRLAYLLKNLKEGESITIGSFDGNATYKVGSSYNGVSHQHLKVTKEHGVLVFEDTSTYGTKASLNKAQPISSKEVKNMFKNGTMDNSYYISKVHHSHMKLDSTDYKLIAELMNKCNGKYRNLWESTCILDNGRNIDKLAAFVKNIRMHGTEKFYTNMDDRTWSTVVNSICQKQNNSVDAVLGYKFGSNVINHSLSEHFAYPPTDKAINAMTDYINTQTIDKRVTIYRGDQYAFMNLAKLPNGLKVGDVMEDMIRRGASQQEINTFINKYLIGNVYKQERFMSCGLNREFCSDWAKKNGMDQSHPNPNGSILWELDVPAGSKAAFVEDYNIIKNYGDEGEVLFQQGSILIIKGAYFDKTRNQWIIQASVRQTPYEQLQRF